MNAPMIENVTFDEISLGQSAQISRTLSKDDIALFATVSGDINPAHLDEEYARGNIFHGVVGHGMWSAGLISAVLGTLLPGPGTIYLQQDIRFRKPVRIGDTITVRVTVSKKAEDKPVVTFDCVCTNDKGEEVATGTAIVLAPVEKIRRSVTELPLVAVQHHDRYQEMIASCRGMDPLPTAIVHPVQPHTIEAVADAVLEKLISPILIGPSARIHQAAQDAGIDISTWPLVNTEHSHGAATTAAALAAQGKVKAIMKGALHTDELLGAIVPSSAGLRTERRISHAYLMDAQGYHKPFIITDAAINIAPTLDEKADICQNAINLWKILYGMDKTPKVAILAAVETVNPKMPATIDAATLCKMSDRGQIEGGILDGPLAFDNAINKEAAAEKGISSPVAGDADILVVPNIESGNMIAKQLTFLGKADAAGIVLGARVPIILTSRADSVRTRLSSCALAIKLAAARSRGLIK